MLALTLGVTAIVSIDSMREVTGEAMIRAVTAGLVGDVQVHGRGYQDSPDMTNVVPDPLAVEARLKTALPEAESERRVLGAGLAASDEVSSPAVVMGIEPDKPSARSVLTVEKGRGLEASAEHEVVIGTSLAEELGLAPGQELVLVGQAADGSLANDRFRIVGTADAGSSEANATAVFLNLADAQSFFALGTGVHQVIVRLPAGDEEDLSQPVSLLRGALDLSALEVLPWSEMLPELKGAIDSKRKNSRAVLAVILLIVGLGILNTMTMATFERTREFGVMASLGTRRRRVLAMVLLEALLQGFIGLGLGFALAWAILHGFGTVDFSSFGGNADVLGARLPDAVRLSLNRGSVVLAGVTTMLTMLVGGLAPAIRASRLKPVEATRYV